MEWLGEVRDMVILSIFAQALGIECNVPHAGEGYDGSERLCSDQNENYRYQCHLNE